MRKYVTAIALIIASIVISITSVKASTKLVFSEVSNGNINTTLNFEAGFIGGIDLKLQLKGNVEYKDFKLNNNITDKKYTTSIKYDSNTKIVNILIVTGGVGTSYNLLNSKRELALGTLVVEANSQNNIEYSIDCSALTILDNAWKSSQIEPEEVNNKLTYKVQKEDSNEHQGNQNENNAGSSQNNKDDNQTSDNNNSQGNQTDNNLTGGNQTNNSSKPSAGVNSNNSAINEGLSGNDKAEENAEDEDETKKDEDDDQKDKEDSTNKTKDDDEDVADKKENKEENDKSISNLWLIILTAIILVLATAFFTLKKKKKSDNEFDI